MSTNPDATAFPLSGAAQFTAQFSNLSGLTKREYFATAALQACTGSFNSPSGAAKAAVRLADALITALNEPESPAVTNEPPF